VRGLVALLASLAVACAAAGRPEPEEASARLLHGIARAHVQLFEPSAPPKERIGTTFAGIVVCRGGRIVMAHVGSSRVYLLRRERRVLDRLTDDHTLLAASQLWGVPCGETATGRDARTLTQAIGATRKVATSTAARPGRRGRARRGRGALT
jgi:serine/threonine protein phosphatase PrpC